MTLDIQDEGRDILEAEGVYDFGTAGDVALYGMFCLPATAVFLYENSYTGHWGRAYADGYNCASEEELRYQCGVVI